MSYRKQTSNKLEKNTYVSDYISVEHTEMFNSVSCRLVIQRNKATAEVDVYTLCLTQQQSQKITKHHNNKATQ